MAELTLNSEGKARRGQWSFVSRLVPAEYVGWGEDLLGISQTKGLPQVVRHEEVIDAGYETPRSLFGRFLRKDVLINVLLKNFKFGRLGNQ